MHFRSSASASFHFNIYELVALNNLFFEQGYLFVHKAQALGGRSSRMEDCKDKTRFDCSLFLSLVRIFEDSWLNVINETLSSPFFLIWYVFWLYERINKPINGRSCKRTKVRTDKQRNERKRETNERTNMQMNDRTSEGTKIRRNQQTNQSSLNYEWSRRANRRASRRMDELTDGQTHA